MFASSLHFSKTYNITDTVQSTSLLHPLSFPLPSLSKDNNIYPEFSINHLPACFYIFVKYVQTLTVHNSRCFGQINSQHSAINGQ